MRIERLMSDHDPVLLYLHIPKAAGTTMAALLYEQLRNSEDVQEGKFCSGVYYHPAGFIRELDADSEEEILRTLRRDDLRAVLGHFRYGLHQQVPRPCQYATILREPISRLSSLYQFQRLNESRYGHLNQIRLPEDTDIEHFVTAPPYPEIDNGMTRRLSGVSASIGECDRPMLETAIGNLKNSFAVVGLSDRFDETIVLMSLTFGWPEPPLYYPLNVNTKRQTKNSINSDTADFIREQNAFDVELYQVATNIFHQQTSDLGPAFSEELIRYRERKQLWYSQLGIGNHKRAEAST